MNFHITNFCGWLHPQNILKCKLPIFGYQIAQPIIKWTKTKGLQLFQIMPMALRIHCWNQGIKWRFLNKESLHLFFGYLVFSRISWIMWCTYPYLVNRNHTNQFRNPGIKTRFQRFQKHINENSELWTPRQKQYSSLNWGMYTKAAFWYLRLVRIWFLSRLTDSYKLKG